MLHKKLLGMLLAAALLLSVSLPALATPALEETESPSIISTVISWLGASFGLDLGSEPGAKLGSAVDPTGLEDRSDPDDNEPEDELGIFIDPTG